MFVGIPEKPETGSAGLSSVVWPLTTLTWIGLRPVMKALQPTGMRMRCSQNNARSGDAAVYAADPTQRGAASKSTHGLTISTGCST